VTNRCNQTCRLCPRAGFTRPLGLVEPDRFGRIADEVARHDTVLWLHFLGEPLLHPHLTDLIVRAKQAGVASVGLSTNATLLRGAIVDRLLDSGIDRLDVSLDAGDAEGYRAMRGTDHFEVVTSNLRAFLARRAERRQTTPTVSIQYLLTPELEAALPRIVAGWDGDLGPDDFIKTIEPAPFGGAIPGATDPGVVEHRPPCPWLFGSLMVLQDGTVTMCGADWDAASPIGHVDEASIAEIWLGAEMQRRRAAHLAGRFDEVDLCGSCTDWFLADGHGYRNIRPGQGQRPGPVTVMLRSS